MVLVKCLRAPSEVNQEGVSRLRRHDREEVAGGLDHLLREGIGDFRIVPRHGQIRRAQQLVPCGANISEWIAHSRSDSSRCPGAFRHEFQDPVGIAQDETSADLSRLNASTDFFNAGSLCASDDSERIQIASRTRGPGLR